MDDPERGGSGLEHAVERSDDQIPGALRLAIAAPSLQ